MLALPGSESGSRRRALFSLSPGGPETIGRIKKGAKLTNEGHEAGFIVIGWLGSAPRQTERGSPLGVKRPQATSPTRRSALRRPRPVRPS
jgi:hypothetical protein